MKHFSIFCLTAMLCGSAWADDAQPAQPAPKAGRKQPKTTASKAAKPAATPAPAAPPVKDTQVPTDAVRINDNTWQKADDQGHLWNYIKTPFGVTKVDPNAVSPSSNLPPAAAGFTAVEHGDSVEFGRDTPFGRQKWMKKKTELNDDERAIWLHQSGQKQDTPKSQE
jgi:hypothetical protein